MTFEDWAHEKYGGIIQSDGEPYDYHDWDYSLESMREAFEAGQKSVVLNELAQKGQLLDEIMSHYKVDD